jgi:hypothetical protein
VILVKNLSAVKSWLIRLGIFIVLSFIIIAAFRSLFGDPEYTVMHSYPSPDGKYKAELSWATWGGWGYTYCFEKVTVQRNIKELIFISAAEIYKGSCYGRKSTDEDFVVWLNDKTLQIALYIERLDGDGYHFSRGAMPDGLKAILKLNLE